MTATPALTTDLKRVVLTLEDDLRDRLDADAAVLAAWREEHRQAVERGRTASSWVTWRDDRVTQVAVSWVLTTVFVRFCEDNALLAPVWITGPGERRQEALDARTEYFRAHPEHTDREWLQQAIAHLGAVRVTAGLVGEHAPLHLASPSGDAASALLAFWWRRDESGALVHDLHDPELSTRFLGDLYQDLSEHAKSTYALLQTPEFVEEFILDRTMEPSLAERQLQGFKMIDPTCGSGHFLLGAFRRLLDRWQRTSPGLEVQAQVQAALDAVHGVDINAFAVAIARFRLTLAALKACGLTSLEQAPAFTLNLAVGDSLLHGPGQQTLGEDADLAGFAYRYEDLAALQMILAGGRYDAVVGNPPYITVKDKMLNQAYRNRYPSCKGTYALTVPFMERFFGLAKPGRDGQPAGWVGQITSNSFMKREFGSKLVESFLSRQDITLLVDLSIVDVPGHTTPTIVIVGRKRAPTSSQVQAVLGLRRQPRVSKDFHEGPAWRSIIAHFAESNYEDEWLSVVRLDRIRLNKHPWSLSGGGALELREHMDFAGVRRLSSYCDAGSSAVTRENSAYLLGGRFLRRRGLPTTNIREVLQGEDVREWMIKGSTEALWPYETQNLIPELQSAAYRVLWPLRTILSSRSAYGETQIQRGLEWYEYSMLFRQRINRPLRVCWAEIATHNHFVELPTDNLVAVQTAPMLTFPVGTSAEKVQTILQLLNSSSALFWLKQNCQNKGGGGIDGGAKIEAWDRGFQYNSANVLDLPVPTRLPSIKPRLSGRSTASELSLPAEVAPDADVLATAKEEERQSLARMVADQEELDWEVYSSYGIVNPSVLYNKDDVPGLKLGERAFEIALARAVAKGSEVTAWFSRHGSTPVTEIPAHWPVAYQEIVQHRIDLMGTDSSMRMLEKPEHKRRWASEPWEKRQTRALRDWLLDRLEDRKFWFDRQDNAAPISVAQLADRVERDADLVSVLALWQGRRDVPVTESLLALLADEAVPYLAALRYTEPGLRKRAVWEETWSLQRREDAGEDVGTIPVPPKYTSAPSDFRKTSYWQARGKLDVPKERFILYPGAARATDSTPLLGWAGWHHGQQSLALLRIIAEREVEGWSDERLVPLVAGLAELQPWVEQWHADVDPQMGLSLASYCAGELRDRMIQVGTTRADLLAWRPEPTRRGRTPRKALT